MNTRNCHPLLYFLAHLLLIRGSLSHVRADFPSYISATTAVTFDVVIFGSAGFNGGFFVNDMNGDGYCDTVIAYASQNTVYLLYGGTSNSYDIGSFNSNMGIELYNLSSGVGTNCFSRSGPAGDFNNDHYGDLLVGCSQEAYLVYGNISTASTFRLKDQTKFEESEPSYVTLEVYTAGDVNNDGYSDILIQNTVGVNNGGYTYLIFGTSSAISSPFNLTSSTTLPTGIVIKGDTNWVHKAYPVGDVNGDGIDDILCASSEANSGTGIAILIYGSNSWTDIDLTNIASGRGVVINGPEANSYFGFTAATAGDVNGDGYGDFMIMAAAYPNTGVVHLFYGSNSLPDVISSATYITEATGIVFTGPYESFGLSLVGTDMNGDKFSDVIIADYVAGTNGVGEVYIFYGAASLPSAISYTEANVVLGGTSESVDTYFGTKLSVGDFNGDGIDDLFVSSEGTSMYVLFGRPASSISLTPSETPSIVLESSHNEVLTTSVPLLLPSSTMAAVPSSSKAPIDKGAKMSKGKKQNQGNKKHQASSQPSPKKTTEDSSAATTAPWNPLCSLGLSCVFGYFFFFFGLPH